MTSPSTDDWLRPLGATGLTVSAVCAGGALLAGMPEVFGYDVSRAEAVAVIDRVFDSPLRWIDTSNGYGDGESELRIGQAIAARGGLPDGFLVATKVDARGDDYSGARVRASVAESKERLGLEQLPLVYLHDPEFHDFGGMRDAVDTLMRLRDEGEIGHVGLAGGSVRELSRYLDLGGFEVLLVHNRWSLVDHSAEHLIERALSDDLAVVNAAIYGGGILANPQGGSAKYGYRDAPAATLEAVAQMDRACREHGIDLATAALQHSVNDPRIAGTVVGFSKPARVDQLITALETEIPAELTARLAELMPDKAHWLETTP
ncbi:aldo/keto reductase [Kribbella flavida DSM 17836]|uniref:Aldo/keto reductase n=1 Tax=Kribbella flavida (strain DSM 17836 / JCM 10339 / NBRC 14399) TaxID=479435 RepID=D2PKR0_KRIFD|nr:aldo/keto reductase [Kribbella flavida]ADB32377.1 aldo/keto reductase [Kribbella flavida DSM 17836]